MADNFRQIVRQLLTYCPFAPLPLCELWVRNRWRSLCETRNWSFLRSKNQFVISASVNGTATVTRGSNTVLVDKPITLDSSVTGRQIKIASQAPVYTVTRMKETDLYFVLTIDMPYGGTSGNFAMSVLTAYVTTPSDFLTFIDVVNIENWWRMYTHTHTSEDIDKWDPRRTHTGIPWTVAALLYSVPSPDLPPPTSPLDPPNFQPTPMFELWPHPTGNYVFPYTYIKRTEDMSEQTVLPRVITGDILFMGALADLSRWPGLEDRKNPTFSLALADVYEREFTWKVGQAGRQDNEIYQKDLAYDGWPYAPIAASVIQKHGMVEIPSPI